MSTAAVNAVATNSLAAQPVAEDDGPLSPWWLRAVAIVMVLGFAGLILITTLSYRNAPPVPARTVGPRGALLFSADDVGEGQAVFLRYGLMANGSIWGHGAYLGPDFSAAALHRMGTVTAEVIARDQHHQAFGSLTRSQAAAVQAETSLPSTTAPMSPVVINGKTNRGRPWGSEPSTCTPKRVARPRDQHVGQGQATQQPEVTAELG